MQVLREFKYAVGGFDIRTFKAGTPAEEVPEDARAFGKKEGYIGEGKAVEKSAEDKSRKTGDKERK